MARVSTKDRRSERILNRVRDRVNLSKDRFRGQNQVFREINRMYLSLSPEMKGRTNDQPYNDSEVPTQPDIYNPISFTLIREAVPTWLFQLFPTYLALRVLGRTREDQKNAEGIQDLLTYDFMQAKVFLNSIPIGESVFKYGTGLFEVGWKYDEYDRKEVWERREVVGLTDDGTIIFGDNYDRRKVDRPVVRYDGPWMNHISVYNAHVDPLGTEIDEMRFFIHEYFTDRAQLERKSDMHARLTGQKLYSKLDEINPMRKAFVEDIMHEAETNDDFGRVMGWSGGTGHSMNRYFEANVRGGRKEKDVRNQLVRVTEYWSQDETNTAPDRKVVIANGETVIEDGPNPWEDKRLPFGAVRCFRVEDQFWGMGKLHPIRDLQYMSNAWRNAMMRNGALNANRVWAVDESVDMPEDASYVNPGDVFQVPFYNGTPMMADLYQGHALPAEAYQYEDRLINDIQRAVGSTAMIEPTADTATEAQMMRSGIATRERLTAAQGELEYLVELGKFFISRRQQFFDREMTIRILGPDGVDFKRLTPEQVAGEYDYMAVGANFYPNQNVIRQQMLELLAQVKGDPVLLELVDMPTFIEELIKSYDIPYHTRLLRPPVEKTADPTKENLVMMAGVAEDVAATEPHEKHIQVHEQGLMKAISQGAGDNVIELFEKHIEEHNRFVEVQEGRGGLGNRPQERPNAVRGEPGNIGNLQNAMPSEGQILSRMGGAAG